MNARTLAVGLVALALAVVAVVIATRTRAPHAPTASPPPTAPPRAGDGSDAAAPPVHAARDGGAPAAHGRAVLTVPWGAGAGQLGRRANPESLAEGPMSLLVDKRGFVILDTVNRRVARFAADGRALPPIALDSDAAQDLARTRSGVAVLDRLHDKRVTVYDADGAARARLPLVGPGIGEAAAVTGIFGDRDGDVYAEREHGAWMRLAGPDGSADAARSAAPGRPMRDGRFVNAALVDRAAGLVRVRVYADAESAPAWETTVRLGAPALFVALADGDARGRVYLGAHTGREQSTPPYAIVDESLVLVALSPSGAVETRLVLPAPPPAEEAFRDLYVGDDGTVYWMRRTAAGVVVEAYRL